MQLIYDLSHFRPDNCVGWIYILASNSKTFQPTDGMYNQCQRGRGYHKRPQACKKFKPDMNSPTYRNSLSTNQKDTTALPSLSTLILNAKNENLEHNILSAPHRHTHTHTTTTAPHPRVSTLFNQHETPKLRKQWASPIESQSG
jgi:hypothetical protein